MVLQSAAGLWIVVLGNADDDVCGYEIVIVGNDGSRDEWLLLLFVFIPIVLS